MIPLLMVATMIPAEPASLSFVSTDTGLTRAVVVGAVPIVHTRQVFGKDLDAAWHELESVLKAAGTSPDKIARLNVYAASDEVAEAVRKSLPTHFPHKRLPAVTYVTGKLVDKEATVALDAIAAGSGSLGKVEVKDGFAVLPVGSRVYISGQAEKGATPAEATRKTLASLKKTMEWLGGSLSDVVHAKSFLTPVSAAGEVNAEFEAMFGKGKVPPHSIVEWSSTLPIEIELVASVPAVKAPAPAVEYLTPPGMTASPVYCRVARISSPKTIYCNGLFAKQAGDGASEVLSVFEQLQGQLDQTGSDLKHLVKATYYVSSNDTSSKLNELRPRFYDPKRPPAASKAQVAGTGMKARALTIDLIAVPKE